MKNTTKVLKWRLGKLPTPDEAMLLVKSDIITKEEARDILFNIETPEEDREKESLKVEVVFLRRLVENLGSYSTIVERIRYIEKPYSIQPWFRPYAVWCSSSALVSSGTPMTISGTTTGYSINSNAIGGTASNGFSSIKTF